MRALVTGGAGFVGTNLIKKLLSDNHTVLSIDNYSTGKRDNEIDGCFYIPLDINIFRHMSESILGEIDIVFHLAAVARIHPSFENPQEYIDTNFQGTYEVVKYF